MTMDNYQSLRRAGTIAEPPPDILARAQQILLEYIGAEETPDATRARTRTGRHLFVVSGIVATAAAVAAVAVLLPGGGGPQSEMIGHARKHVRSSVLLSTRTVALISSRSAAVTDSGTAVETTENSTNAALQGPPQTIDVTFSGKNVNYLVTSNGDGAEGVQNRVVDGQFYLYIKGQDLQMHWYHDTSPNAADSASFPDPRTLLEAINPSAGLETVGRQSVNGMELTHLRATHPASIGSLDTPDVSSTVISFDVWVGSDNVVRRMRITSSDGSFMCEEAPGAAGSTPNVDGPATIRPSERIATLPDGQPVPAGTICGNVQTTELDIRFGTLGVPESIGVPPGAIDQEGLG
jgi:hypothetical protein